MPEHLIETIRTQLSSGASVTTILPMLCELLIMQDEALKRHMENEEKNALVINSRLSNIENATLNIEQMEKAFLKDEEGKPDYKGHHAYHNYKRGIEIERREARAEKVALFKKLRNTFAEDSARVLFYGGILLALQAASPEIAKLVQLIFGIVL